MRFIPLQKWNDIILCCHSNRMGQTLMVSWHWQRVIYGINLRVLVSMVTELCTDFILQWYETYTMLCDGMECISVLSLKSQRHTFARTNTVSQINKFFVKNISVLSAFQYGAPSCSHAHNELVGNFVNDKNCSKKCVFTCVFFFCPKN